jgi:hypothetical protein
MSLGGRVTREVLDCYFNATNITAPTTVYVSLHTGDPGEDGQGANEVSGNGYAREAASFGAASGTDPSTVSNDVAVEFDTPSGSWGTVTYFGLWSSLTETGEAYFLGGGALTTPRTIGTGEDASFAIGELDITLD